jgi:hypothetical protein
MTTQSPLPGETRWDETEAIQHPGLYPHDRQPQQDAQGGADGTEQQRLAEQERAHLAAAGPGQAQ